MRNLLELRPVRLCPTEALPDGRVAALVPRFGEGRVGRWLGRTLGRPTIRVRLDPLGARVYDLCDGSLTVGEMADRLTDALGASREGFQRLAVFLRRMQRTGLVNFEERPSAAPSP